VNFLRALPCRKRNLMAACVSILLKSRASPDMLPFSLCKKNRFAIRYVNRPLFPNTIDSLLRHQEVGRAENLSAPHCTFKHISTMMTSCLKTKSQIHRPSVSWVSPSTQKLKNIFVWLPTIYFTFYKNII